MVHIFSSTFTASGNSELNIAAEQTIPDILDGFGPGMPLSVLGRLDGFKMAFLGEHLRNLFDFELAPEPDFLVMDLSD